MKPFLISAIRIGGVLLGLLVVMSIGFSVLENRAQSSSINKLDAFSNSVPLGTSRGELAVRVGSVQEFRFTDVGDSAFVRFHSCHCTFHFAQDRVVRINRAICNG